MKNSNKIKFKNEWYTQITIDGEQTMYYISRSGKMYSCHKGDNMVTPKNKNGYVKVGLRLNNSIYYQVYLHTLMMKTFKPQDKKITTNHIDGNKANNAINNLEYASYKENMKHALLTGLVKSKGHVKRAVTLEKEGSTILIFRTLTAAAEHLGCTKTAIQNVLSGKQITVKGYKVKDI